MAKTSKTVSNLAKLNETGNRKTEDRRQAKATTARVSTAKESHAKESRKVKRRRQIDPTTCEREYTDQEVEFMRAMDEYKRISGRMFPTCSEILEVLTGLGYRQIADIQEMYNPNPKSNSAADSTAEAVSG